MYIHIYTYIYTCQYMEAAAAGVQERDSVRLPWEFTKGGLLKRV